MHNKAEASGSQNRKRLSRIEALPTAVHHLGLFSFLSEQDLGNLAQASKALQQDYSNSPSRIKASEKLLTHIVKAEEEQALAMIDANPTLLLYASNAIDYSNRLYSNQTPFQAALLCHDVTLWKKMEPYFERPSNGEGEKTRQFNALFPQGIPERRPYDFSALAQIITNSAEADINAALQKTQNNTEICQALNHFRDDFTALSMQEMFFNPSHLLEALKIYSEQFDSWSWGQRNLYWRQVIGYTQRFVPACFAQAFVQGLYCVVEEKQPLARSLKFKYDDGSYFPLRASSGLGFDFGICAVGAAMRRSHFVFSVGGAWRLVPGMLINYVEQIQQSFLALSVECNMPMSPLRTTTP